MSYPDGPTLADAVEGYRMCFECDRSTPWLHGDREPVTCAYCGGHIACVDCGEAGFELDADGKCSACVTPRVTYVDAVETEFGLSLVKRAKGAA